MKILRILSGSSRILLDNGARSLLAIGGVAIGVALVLVTSTVGDAARSELLRGADPTGTHLLVVRAASNTPSPARKSVKGLVSSLTREDSEAIEELRAVSRAAPVLDGQLKVHTAAGTANAKVVGCTEALLDVRGYAVASGRPFSEFEEGSAARVAVLGARIAERLFPDGDPVDQTLRIRGVPFEVVGVLRPVGASADGSDHDSQLLLPLRTAQRRLYDSRSLTFVYVTVRNPDLLEAAEGEIARLLRRSHRLTKTSSADDFTIQSQAKAASFRTELARALDMLRGGFGAVSLLIGGAGILGLMLLSVEERKGEIALRIAVGARPKDVATQFVSEALLLASSGGLVGVGLGLGCAWTAARVFQWEVVFSTETALAPLLLAVLTGVLAGALPAAKAARVPPSQAFARQ